MLENNARLIRKIQLLSEQVLQVVCAHSWHDEDIPTIRDQLVTSLPNATLLTHSHGADRAMCRFAWRQHNWLLHFDYYSQSIWLESETSLLSTDRVLLAELANCLITQFLYKKHTR